MLESMTVMSKGVGIEAVEVNLSYDEKGKGKLVSDTVFPEKAMDEMMTMKKKERASWLLKKIIQ